VIGLSLVGSLSAQAHVRVHPDSTTTGSYSALTFRVPNESPTAGTVRVAVRLPQDQPFRSVSVKPVAGWTVAAAEASLPQPVESDGTTLTKAVRTVTWTAEKGTQIEPGQYQEFSISVGPLPAPGTVLLPVDQTYSDGKVVSWEQPTPSSGVEPERPAPALEVAAASAEASPAAQGPVAGPDAADAATRSDGPARLLSGAALAVAVIGATMAAVALRRVTGRRSG
jgi:uncharacterized protein YcnI